MQQVGLLKFMILGCVAVLLTLAVACSDDDEKTSGGTATQSRGASATASVCDQKDVVEESVRDLASTDVVAEGTNALKASVDDLKTEVGDLKEVVSNDVKDEVEGLEQAVSDAQDTLEGINDDATLSERKAEVSGALTSIATASAALATALKKDCP